MLASIEGECYCKYIFYTDSVLKFKELRTDVTRSI